MAIAFGAFAPFVQTVNNVDYFTLEDHPDEQFYEEFKEVFGNDEFFVIAFEKQAIFTPDTLGMIKVLTSKLESSDLVRDVVSLANVDNIISPDAHSPTNAGLAFDCTNKLDGSIDRDIG